MPLPPIPSWIGKAGSGCGNTTVLLTLENMQKAIQNAKPEERNSFAVTLNQDCNVALQTGDSLATSFNNAAGYDYAFINDQLRTVPNFLETQDMIHANGNALLPLVVAFCDTLNDNNQTASPMAISMLDAPDDIKAALGCAQATTLAAAADKDVLCFQNLFETFNIQVNQVDRHAPFFALFLQDVLKPILDKLIRFNYICDPALPSGAHAVVSPDGVIVITTNLHGIVPCGGEGGGMGVADDNVRYWACGQTDAPTNLNVPMVADAQGRTQAPLFQLIIDKLSNLEACCPPCKSSDRLLLTGVQGVGNATLPGEGNATEFESIFFEITQQGVQGGANFSNPPRWKYGTFTWVFGDGTHSNPQFVNYDDHRFFTPRDEAAAVGIAWHMEPGIIANVYGAPIPPWKGGVVYD